MKEYIKKSAVVVEIKRRIFLFKKEKKIEKWSAGASQMNVVSLGSRIAMLEEILSFINNLEVKEVDLEKEIKLYKMRNPIVGHREESLNNYMSNVAKYFFGLGLKVNKGE